MADYFGSVAFEVFIPFVFARMKQPHRSVSIRVEAEEIGAFAEVAVGAGECEVFGSACAPVLAGDDVLNVEWRIRLVPRVEMAILASGSRPLPNPVAQLCVHKLTRLSSLRGMLRL